MNTDLFRKPVAVALAHLDSFMSYEDFSILTSENKSKLLDCKKCLSTLLDSDGEYLEPFSAVSDSVLCYLDRFFVSEDYKKLDSIAQHDVDKVREILNYLFEALTLVDKLRNSCK